MRPDGYTLYPANDQFADLPNNWMVRLNHTQHLLPPKSRLNEFDILFFQSGHVGVLVRVDGVDSVLESDPSHWQVATLPLAQVKQREGGLVAIGRVLPKPFVKRY